MSFARMVPVLYVLLNVLESRAKIGQDLNCRDVLFGNRPIDIPAKLQVTVRVYNSAHVSLGDLIQAEEHAARIFRQARIKVIWDHVPMANEVQDHAESEAWNPADLHLRLWTRAMVGSNTFGEDTLGFRLNAEKSTAIIIADEIHNRAAIEFTNPSDLLSLVMAHELGHLLLRSAAHSAWGIMQGRLPTDLKDRRRTLLVFTPEQADFMRGEVRRRMGILSAGKR